MSELKRRVERALGAMTQSESDGGSSLNRLMSQTVDDPDFRRHICAYHKHLAIVATEFELDQAERNDSSPVKAVARAQERALCALFRLAFEAGRWDERSEAADLEAMLTGFGDDDAPF